MSYQVRDLIHSWRKTARPLRVLHPEHQVGKDRSAFEDTAADLRARYPELFHRVDALLHMPFRVWRPTIGMCQSPPCNNSFPLADRGPVKRFCNDTCYQRWHYHKKNQRMIANG